jgi:hypothetical protein
MKIISSIITSLFITTPLFSTGQTQAQGSYAEPLYVAFSYIKITPGKRDVYLNLIHQYSPKITANRIAQGGVLGWYMYEVKLPSGAAAPYDFVSLTVANDFALHFDNLAPSEEVMKSIVPGASMQTINEIFEKYESSRTIIKKEIAIQLSNLFPEHTQARFILTDYIKVDPLHEPYYLALESSTLAPLRREMIQTGGYANWSLYKVHLPKDEHSDFNFVTLMQADQLDSFSERKLVESGTKIMAAFNNKGKDSQKKEIRSVSRTELWELVEYVDQFKLKK